MTVTIPTGDLCGILADCLPFVHTLDDLPALCTVRLEWDGQQLHAMATDRYRLAWSTWDPADHPDAEGDQQGDLFTDWGSDDGPWSVLLPAADAKDAVTAFKLKPKERGAALTLERKADAAGPQLAIDRSRLTGHSALRMVITGVKDDDYPDLRQLLADASTAEPVHRVAYTLGRLADFGKVRPRGPLRLTFTGEHKLTLVEIGERFTGAIQPVREEDA